MIKKLLYAGLFLLVAPLGAVNINVSYHDADALCVLDENNQGYVELDNGVALAINGQAQDDGSLLAQVAVLLNGDIHATVSVVVAPGQPATIECQAENTTDIVTLAIAENS
jgi:hypothetical protein